MDDLERFFRRLVASVAIADPARLHGQLGLDEIQRELLPYRINRRALGLESSEDYEFVLLRLCAGEGRLVRTEPEEARARFAAEARSANPDLGVLRRFDGVLVTLEPAPLARVLKAEPEPEPRSAPLPSFEREALEIADALELPGSVLPSVSSPESAEALADDLAAGLAPLPDTARCGACGGELPGDRPVRFCPHCGRRQASSTCPACHHEVDPGWRHCVSCGMLLSEP